MATQELNKPPSLPPYPQMILEALDELKQAEGANKSSISNYMESKYGEMPAGHADFLTHHLTRMKDSGELLFIKNNYLKPGPDAPPKRGRGRPPKPKEPLSPGATAPAPASASASASASGPTRPRGRPRKDPNAPPAPKKPKPQAGPPSISNTGRPRGRPKKVNAQPLQNAAEV